ncbi:MAG TPA: hypothetical protein VGG03_01240 [Thermoanaerobaculia bacterium]|jgi:hypothetical protein
MIKRLFVTLALAGMLFAISGVAGAQERPARSSAAIQKALEQYMRQVDVERGDQAPQLKAVPRADKAEAAVIGRVTFVDGADFLDDGTPFRIVAVTPNKPFTQDVFVVCLGTGFTNSCGRLIEGRRASFTSDILVIDEGESAGLALFIVKKLQT